MSVRRDGSDDPAGRSSARFSSSPLIIAGCVGRPRRRASMAFFRVRSRRNQRRALPPAQRHHCPARRSIRSMSLWDDLEPLRERIRHHPQVTDVTITRRMPGTLVVTIAGESAGRAGADRGPDCCPTTQWTAAADRSVARDQSRPSGCCDNATPLFLSCSERFDSAEPRVFARIEEVRRAGRDEILLTLSAPRALPVHAGDSAVAERTLRVRAPVGPVSRAFGRYLSR